MLYMGIAGYFCFTEQQYGNLSCSELNAKTDPEVLGRGGATLKPGIVRYDLNTELCMCCLGCQIIMLLLENVHLVKECEK